MVVKKRTVTKRKPVKIVTANVKRLGAYGSNTFLKQEKRKMRRGILPRKSDLGKIEPMAIAILEAERHRNQLCRFNHHIFIDSKGRWVIDDEVIMDDPAGEYIRAAKKLSEMGYDFVYMRNHPTLTDPETGETVSLTLSDAEYIIRNELR